MREIEPLYERTLPDGRVIVAYDYLFNIRVMLCRPDLPFPAVLNEWCFEKRSSFRESLQAWDGKGFPTGWMKHVASGKFSQEYKDAHPRDFIFDMEEDDV